MTTKAHWNFTTQKYSLVDTLDYAIVVATFNQKEVKRDLLKIRLELLDIQTYDELVNIMEKLTRLSSSVTDERLIKVLKMLLEQMTQVQMGNFSFNKQNALEQSKASE
jgi:hypothetical protein